MIASSFAAAGYMARGLAFVIRKQSRRPPPYRVHEIRLDLGTRVVRADVYAPDNAVPRPGVVLFLHGMTAYGNRDVRIVDFCAHLTAFGHAIVVPHFEEVTAFSTDAAIVDDLERTIRAIVADRRLSPDGAGIGFMSVSFSATYGLSAACRPAVRDSVRALCLIGGLYSAEAVQELICAGDQNHFPRDVLFLNYLNRSLGRRPGLELALRTALEDNSLARAVPELPACLASIDAGDRALFLRLRDDPRFRAEHAGPIVDCIAAMFAETLRDRGQLRAQAVLIHGARDPVFPSSESRRLHRDLLALGVRSHLEVSPLLGHNEALALRPSLCAPVLRLVGSFARFFHEVGR